jgi:uncharacterized membrane protein YdjX (TVP38/TMEM64 family)
MIEKVVQRYHDFLMFRDERMIIVNRIAPIVPFLGAFVAICCWSFRKSIAFTLLGGMIKYGIIIAASGAFFAYFSSGTAQTVTIVMILVIMAVSFAISLSRRRKMRKRDENSSR